MSSKWLYIGVGVNVMIVILGAIIHNIGLIIIGFIFAIWNWYTAEKLRRIEDEQIRRSVIPKTNE